MRIVQFLLAAIALIFTMATASAVPQTCCGDEDCPIMQCIAMHCAAAPAAMTVPAAVRAFATGTEVAPAAAIAAPVATVVKDIWTPPD
jgi:hypothetical protein